MRKEIAIVRSLLPILLVGLTCLVSSCKDEDETFPTPPAGKEIPNTYLSGNELILRDIVGIPEEIIIDQIKVNITGIDWQVIGTVEAVYDEEQTVLTLPAALSVENLQKVARENKTDYTGRWYAATDNADARVAGLADITACYKGAIVGIIHLTDWSEGSMVNKSWIYFHYADQPFTLSTHTTNKDSFRYQASFKSGWNAFANTNLNDNGSVLCTTDLPEEKKYSWRFVSHVY